MSYLRVVEPGHILRTHYLCGLTAHPFSEAKILGGLAMQANLHGVDFDSPSAVATDTEASNLEIGLLRMRHIKY